MPFIPLLVGPSFLSFCLPISVFTLLFLLFIYFTSLFSLLVFIDILSKEMTPVNAKFWIRLCSFSGDVMQTFFNFILSGTCLSVFWLLWLTYIKTERKVLCGSSWRADGDRSSACRQDSTWGSSLGSLLRLWIPKEKACLLHAQVVQAQGCSRGTIYSSLCLPISYISLLLLIQWPVNTWFPCGTWSGQKWCFFIPADSVPRRPSYKQGEFSFY